MLHWLLHISRLASFLSNDNLSFSYRPIQYLYTHYREREREIIQVDQRARLFDFEMFDSALCGYIVAGILHPPVRWPYLIFPSSSSSFLIST